VEEWFRVEIWACRAIMAYLGLGYFVVSCVQPFDSLSIMKTLFITFIDAKLGERLE